MEILALAWIGAKYVIRLTLRIVQFGVRGATYKRRRSKEDAMRINKLFLLIGWIVSCFLFFEVAAHASEWDEATKITFSQPVQVPRHTLAPGTYLFKRADTNDQNIVQIFNADGNVLYGTFMTNPTTRPEAAGNTEVLLAKQAEGEPYVLLKWFYPGRLTGDEFIYPKAQEQQLAQDRHEDIVAGEHAAVSGD